MRPTQSLQASFPRTRETRIGLRRRCAVLPSFQANQKRGQCRGQFHDLCGDCPDMGHLRRRGILPRSGGVTGNEEAGSLFYEEAPCQLVLDRLGADSCAPRPNWGFPRFWRIPKARMTVLSWAGAGNLEPPSLGTLAPRKSRPILLTVTCLVTSQCASCSTREDLQASIPPCTAIAVCEHPSPAAL